MTHADPPLALDPSHDVAMIADVFARAGRIHIPRIFTSACAERIHACLVGETPWRLHLNDGSKHFDVDDERISLLPDADRVLLLDSMHANARAGRFQCVYHNFPIYDAYQERRYPELYLMRLYEYLNSEAFLNFARAVTAMPGIAFVDAQATQFRAGHFLTQHEDLAEGKHRLAAYVFNFTRPWHPDWGGVLQFIDDDGHISEGYTPTFNALNLFRIPQRHSVSFVAPYAHGARYSITGWLRGKS
jgi:SM-20-related protein